MSSLLAELDSTPNVREGVRRLLNGALNIHFDEDNPGGCLVVLSVLESGQHDEHSSAVLENTIRELKQGLQARLTKAKRQGELSADLDTGSIATTIASSMTGMMVLGKAHFRRSDLKKTINQVLRLLDQPV